MVEETKKEEAQKEMTQGALIDQEIDDDEIPLGTSGGSRKRRVRSSTKNRERNDLLTKTKSDLNLSAEGTRNEE